MCSYDGERLAIPITWWRQGQPPQKEESFLRKRGVTCRPRNSSKHLRLPRRPIDAHCVASLRHLLRKSALFSSCPPPPLDTSGAFRSRVDFSLYILLQCFFSSSGSALIFFVHADSAFCVGSHRPVGTTLPALPPPPASLKLSHK